jgi:hypothetical protein
MRGRIVHLIACFGVSCSVVPRAVAEDQAPCPPVAPPPVVFDGFGLEGFRGSGSLAAALRGIDAQQADLPLGVPVDVVVKGPSGRDRVADPLAAELKGRLEGIDLVAGLQADSTVVDEGPKKVVGGVRMSRAHGDGREALELKTSLGRQQQAGVLGIEVGPRIERRLPGGLTVFLDGKAQAQARRSIDDGSWAMPGLAGDAGGSLGVAASTGVTR